MGSHAPCLVVGFDRRPESHAALRVAGDLAQRLGGSLRVVHAVEVEDLSVDPDEDEWLERSSLASEEEAEIAGIIGGTEGWVLSIEHGDPAKALAGVADACDAVMIVIGSRGEGWRRLGERILSPSVGHHLVEFSARPVLVVPHHR